MDKQIRKFTGIASDLYDEGEIRLFKMKDKNVDLIQFIEDEIERIEIDHRDRYVNFDYLSGQYTAYHNVLEQLKGRK